MSGAVTLAEDVDKVPLIRLYPEASGISDAAAKALAQGEATKAAGETLESSQYEPIFSSEASATAPTAPPVNVDVPHATQSGTGAGSSVNCTMGNWSGTPTGYAYQWNRGGVNVGTGGATYTVSAPDIGGTLTCVVTATNALGSTAAPPSNGVVVA